MTEEKKLQNQAAAAGEDITDKAAPAAGSLAEAPAVEDSDLQITTEAS